MTQPNTISTSDAPRHQSAGLSRRQALLRLGLASAVAYAVPTLIHLDRAQAHVSPSNCKFQNKKYCK